MDNQIRQLEELAIQGDPEALTTLLHEANTSEDDDDICAYTEAFDRAAVLYAMGPSASGQDEWYEFKEIVHKYNELAEHRMDLERYEEAKRRTEFDMHVLDKMEPADERVRSIQNEEQESVPYALPFIESSIKESLERIDYCMEWIREARTLLKSPRFRDLSEEVFDELVEVVSFELADMEVDAEDNDHGILDEDSEKFEWFDDCAICQGMKEAEEEGREMSIEELDELFKKQNQKGDQKE